MSVRAYVCLDFSLLFSFSHLFGLGMGGPASQRVAGVWQDPSTTGEASGKLWENMCCELGGREEGGLGSLEIFSGCLSAWSSMNMG